MALTPAAPQATRQGLVLLLGLGLLVGLPGCVNSPGQPQPGSGSGSAAGTTGSPASVLRLATTTSTADTGLMDDLLPAFEATHNARVDVIAVETKPWARFGTDGAIVHMKGRGDFISIFIR